MPPSPNLPSVHPAVHRLAAVSSSLTSSVVPKAPESKDRPLREERDDEVSYLSFGAENSLPSLFNAGASLPGESVTNVREEEKAAHSFYSGIEQIMPPPSCCSSATSSCRSTSCTTRRPRPRSRRASW